MNLTNDIDSFIEILKMINFDTHEWDSQYYCEDTYYKSYNEALHVGEGAVNDFDFSNPVEFKRYLDALWKGFEADELKKYLVKKIIQTQGRAEGMLPEVDTHNYMM